MKNLFINPITNDLRKGVTYVGYAIAIVCAICCAIIVVQAILYPDNITFGMIN